MGLRLVDGSRVCIVGGGPSGSFAALHLLDHAKRFGLNLDIFIFEHRDFRATGRRGCKGCAGILSSRLLSGLESIGLPLPEEVIQSELHAFTIHIDNEIFRICQPEPHRRVVSVYRGSGPQRAKGNHIIGFDNFLLTEACKRGARLVPYSVDLVTYENRPVVYSSHERYPADLLVLATGINREPPLAPEFGYRMPKTKKMVHGEVVRPPDWLEDEVRVYFKNFPGFIFGVITPKGRYLNISILGNGSDQRWIGRLINSLGRESSRLSENDLLCGCMPNIAIGSAGKYFGERWVAVGDSAVSRLYKDGIGSAFFTSKAAIQAAIQSGISTQSFRNSYVPYCQQITFDNMFGRLLMQIWIYSLRSPRLLAAWKNTIRFETTLSIDQRIHTNNLWGLFTGDARYQDLFWRYLSPLSLHHLKSGFINSTDVRKPAFK